MPMGATFKVDYAGTQAGRQNIAMVQGFLILVLPCWTKH